MNEIKLEGNKFRIEGNYQEIDGEYVEYPEKLLSAKIFVELIKKDDIEACKGNLICGGEVVLNFAGLKMKVLLVSYTGIGNDMSDVEFALLGRPYLEAEEDYDKGPRGPMDCGDY